MRVCGDLDEEGGAKALLQGVCTTPRLTVAVGRTVDWSPSGRCGFPKGLERGSPSLTLMWYELSLILGSTLKELKSSRRAKMPLPPAPCL